MSWILLLLLGPGVLISEHPSELACEEAGLDSGVEYECYRSE